ncbi:phytanoyl-CoA dioxygenase domain-containing protein 1-like [Strongylocentrotus purpuratus]|uniref:Phytanoyl-CoA dioxygenase domain-containing protein 1 n=1 Tax=Strongylocentrotus purpuratus TaxID=7668 RepID=A0A7M7PLU9_STRPU|nr:phytanoyl-CoA dioxygenase domain-containing protein 1-like [Strongylocentrotus purpuratus]
MASQEQRKQFEKDGFLVVENFLTKEEVESLKTECHYIVQNMDPKQHARCMFETLENTQFQNEYFMTSGDKIRFFFEKEALDKEGNLLVDKHCSLNKVGHALHELSPPFKKVSCSKKVQDIARNLDFKKPVIVQSMYIFKPPHIGGEVSAHQDAIFMYNTPLKLIGYWIALEDAEIDNSCLHFIPGSHSRDITTRMVKDPDGTATSFQGDPYPMKVPEEDFIPVPVKAGSLILIDEKVIHRSSQNTSDRSRHIYTFHVAESEKTEWSKENWLQPTPEKPFTQLYTQD